MFEVFTTARPLRPPYVTIMLWTESMHIKVSLATKDEPDLYCY